MAAGINESEYRQKLRARHTSTVTPEMNNPDGSTPKTMHPLNSEPQPNQQIYKDVTQKESYKSSEQGTQTVSLQEVPVVNMADFEVVDANDKLNLLMAAINKINTNFHYKMEDLNHIMKKDKGVLNRLSSMETNVQELQARVDDSEGITATIPQYNIKVDKLEETVNKLSDEVAVLKGLLQVHDRDIAECKTKTVDLTARSMANNITITGLTGDSADEKNCKEKVLTFFREKLGLIVKDKNVEVAHVTVVLFTCAILPIDSHSKT